MAHYKRVKKLVAKNRVVFNEMLASIYGKHRIQLIDRSNFEPGMCCNGGKYEFVTNYDLDENTGEYAISYETSAEFSYCTVHGTWRRCGDCSQYSTDFGCGDMCERISASELASTMLKPLPKDYWWKVS